MKTEATDDEVKPGRRRRRSLSTRFDGTNFVTITDAQLLSYFEDNSSHQSLQDGWNNVPDRPARMSQGKIDVNKLPRKVTKPTISCFHRLTPWQWVGKKLCLALCFDRLTPWQWVGKDRLCLALYSLLSEGAQNIICI